MTYNPNEKLIRDQARLMFEKTLFDYYENLERIYLKDSSDYTSADQDELSAIHERARSKMKLINSALRKYGIKEFIIPYFVDVRGKL